MIRHGPSRPVDRPHHAPEGGGTDLQGPALVAPHQLLHRSHADSRCKEHHGGNHHCPRELGHAPHYAVEARKGADLLLQAQHARRYTAGEALHGRGSALRSGMVPPEKRVPPLLCRYQVHREPREDPEVICHFHT